jgi:hypothetical protein
MRHGPVYHNIVACLLKAKIMEPGKQQLLGNGCVTLNSVVFVGSGVLYAVRADSYVMQQQNCWKRCFLWGLCRGDITWTIFH